MLLLLMTALVCMAYISGIAGGGVPYASPCSKNTQCGEFGTWQGGKGNCNNKKCECLVTRECGKHKQCCSGKCVNKKCENGNINSICTNYTCAGVKANEVCRINSCQQDLICGPPQAEMLKDWPYGTELGVCRTKVSECVTPVAPVGLIPYHQPCVANISDCERVGHWTGGKGNCYKDLCDCRIHDLCQVDSDCCSNKCVEKICQPGDLEDVCHRGTCKDGLECRLLNSVGSMYSTDKAGTCGVPSLIGEPCGNSTYCRRFGPWPGGPANCKENKCGCVTDSPCNKHDVCCSGTCTAGVCDLGGKGNICGPKTCKPNTNCIDVKSNASITGIISVCADCKPFLSQCLNDTVCCEAYKWDGGISVCNNGKCECKTTEKCTSDRQCCSNKCTVKGECVPSGLDQLCSNGSCEANLYCDKTKGPKGTNFGICSHETPFNKSCNKDTYCAIHNTWPGGIGNCLNATCMCSEFPASCKESRQCCSNSCENNKCSRGTNTSFCSTDSCDKGLDCLKKTNITEYIKMVDTCNKCSPWGTICDSKTFCCNGKKNGANVLWPGGLGNCFNGTCNCQAVGGTCQFSEQCCDSKCDGKICVPNGPNINHVCIPGTDSCGKEKGCTGTSTISTPDKGTCEDCSKYSSSCSRVQNKTYCCPVSRWPGKYNNCFEDACKCQVNEKCTTSRHCCSGSCVKDQCVPGRGGDICQVGSCAEKHLCVIPAIEKVVAPLLNSSYGTCVGCLPYNTACNAATTCCKTDKWEGGYGNCYKGKCTCKVDYANETCKHHRECCNNKCVNGRCQPGQLGEWCNSTSCSDRLGCTGKNDFDTELGLCKPCTQLGDECGGNTHCCPVTIWQGGKGVCINGKCNCRVSGKCARSKECCSGNCTNGKCVDGPEGALCDPKSKDSCKPGLKCPTPSNNTLVFKVYGNDTGTCTESEAANAEGLTPVVKGFRMVNTQPDSGFWPWMVHITFGGQRNFTGVLILSRYVLTTARIADTNMVPDISKIRIEVAAQKTGQRENSVSGVRQIIPHPDAFRTGKVTDRYDLALLRLTKEIPKSEDVTFPCVAQKPYGKLVKHCAIAGWMPSTRGGMHVESALVVLDNGTKCPGNDDTQVCVTTAHDSRRTCEDNAGGPLICQKARGHPKEQWQLQGIASFNLDCSKKELSSGFQEISYFKDWILGVVHHNSD